MAPKTDPSPFQTLPELLTAEQVADLIGMSTDWVWTQARRHRIPHIRLGRYRRFRRSAIVSWLEELERES